LVPAILVEIGFVSNPQEEKMLNDRSYRQKVADAITRSIVSYNDG
jgi:N-acetylmuramoyl-L-alanine amidase